jgi:hypothetical protein
MRAVGTPPSRRDRSKYARQFTLLHDPERWGRWYLLDTVSGGGLASRLKADQYKGMQDLEFDVTTETPASATVKTYVLVHGFRQKEHE